MNIINKLNLRFRTKNRLPVIVQSEVAECGLACLAMISMYWGYEIDLRTLRERFAISLKGVTLKTVISMSNELNLRARPLRVNVSQLKALKLPCILHWDMTHFVVLKSISSTGICIHDPAVGDRRIAIIDIGKHFTGVALELQPTDEFRRGREVRTVALRDLMGRVIGLAPGMFRLGSLGLALQACTLAAPFFLQWVIDHAVASEDKNLLTELMIGFILLSCLQAGIAMLRSWFTGALAADLGFQWYVNTFFHLLRLPLNFFENRHLGDIISRFGSIQTIQKTLTTQFVEAVVDGILMLLTASVMLFYSPLLTAIAISSLAIYGIIRAFLFRSLHQATKEQVIYSAKQNLYFLESVRGTQSIRLFNKVMDRVMGWSNLMAAQINSELSILKINVVYQSLNVLLFNIDRIIIVWLGAIFIMSGHFTVGMLLAYLSYKENFTQRMSSLIDKLFEFKMLKLYADRLGDIMLTEPETLESTRNSGDAFTPSIELKNVSFRYADDEPYVLKNVNLFIPAGECIALTGKSGSGKTTLLKILLGLIKPTHGEVLVSGVKIEAFGLANYRDVLGTVMQNDTLFSGSIADNINFFDSTLDLKKIQYAASQAAIHDDISSMPMGYMSLIGDIGTGISGGQKQRILLARALYKSPEILVLDEATSNLDVGNERLVNDAISKLGLTRILVAHREETIAMARRVAELKNGEIWSDTITLESRSSETAA